MSNCPAKYEVLIKQYYYTSLRRSVSHFFYDSWTKQDFFVETRLQQTILAWSVCWGNAPFQTM